MVGKRVREPVSGREQSGTACRLLSKALRENAVGEGSPGEESCKALQGAVGDERNRLRARGSKVNSGVITS